MVRTEKGNHMEKLLQEIFTGNPSYCEKKALELLKRGYKVTKKTFWADGKVSYTMQKVRVY
jgi:hypothetical protein